MEPSLFRCKGSDRDGHRSIEPGQAATACARIAYELRLAVSVRDVGGALGQRDHGRHLTSRGALLRVGYSNLATLTQGWSLPRSVSSGYPAGTSRGLSQVHDFQRVRFRHAHCLSTHSEAAERERARLPTTGAIASGGERDDSSRRLSREGCHRYDQAVRRPRVVVRGSSTSHAFACSPGPVGLRSARPRDGLARAGRWRAVRTRRRVLLVAHVDGDNSRDDGVE